MFSVFTFIDEGVQGSERVLFSGGSSQNELFLPSLKLALGYVIA